MNSSEYKHMFLWVPVCGPHKHVTALDIAVLLFLLCMFLIGMQWAAWLRMDQGARDVLVYSDWYVDSLKECSARLQQPQQAKRKKTQGPVSLIFGSRKILTKVRPKNDGRRPNPAVMLTCPLNWPKDCIPACHACTNMIFRQRFNKK